MVWPHGMMAAAKDQHQVFSLGSINLSTGLGAAIVMYKYDGMMGLFYEKHTL